MKKLNTDKIATMTDDDLNSHFFKIKNLLSYKNHSRNKRDLEIELCYLQREVRVRENRRKAHDVYLRNKALSRMSRKERV